MKWKSKQEILIVFLLGAITGALICYISTQFSYFEIKKELDVPTLLVSIMALIVGIYIASIIQKNINSSQNKYVFLVDKVDVLWSKFNDFSGNITLSTNLNISSIRLLLKNVIHPLAYINNIYDAFELDNNQIIDLESKLSVLENNLSNCPSVNNNIDFSGINHQVCVDVLAIQKKFSEILKELQAI